MPTIELDTNYTGSFEAVGVDHSGNTAFESVQAADIAAFEAANIQPTLEVNTVKWTVAPDGKLRGTAKFIDVRTHHIINAILDGDSPDPPKGQTYREAKVKVTFKGGTGLYADVTGRATVKAQLHNDGISTGRIVGKVDVN